MAKFKIGDKIFKTKGYKFEGTIVSVFETTSGEVRVVAEMNDNGMLHIFNENQLEINNTYNIEIDEFKIKAMEIVYSQIQRSNMSLEESKKHVLEEYKVIFDLDNHPEFIRDYWRNIKEEIITLK